MRPSPHQEPAEGQGKVERRWLISLRGGRERIDGPETDGWGGEEVMPVEEHREEVERLEEKGLNGEFTRRHELAGDPDSERTWAEDYERAASAAIDRRNECKRFEQRESAIDKVVEELERRAKKAKDEAAGHFGDERDVPEGEATAYRSAARLLRKARASKEGE